MIKLFEKYFTYKLSKKRINAYIGKLPEAEVRTAERSSLPRVTCIQRVISPVRSIEQYIDSINSFVHEAYKAGSDIVVFPEYNFFDIMGILPGFSILNKFRDRIASGSSKKVKPQNEDEVNKLLPLLSAIFFSVQTAMEEIMCSIAAKYSIYIYTGSYLIKEGEKLYNTGSLVSREGKVIGKQRKMHLTDFEVKLNMDRCSKLEVFDLDFGRIAIPVCMDATYFETFRLAADMNCDIVVVPIANSEEYSMYRAIRGIWARVQEAYVFGIKSALTGYFVGMHFTGKSGVFAPLELTDKGDGVLAIAQKPEGNQVITVDLDIDRLRMARKEAEYFGDSNSDFEGGYYKKTYVRG